MNKNTEFNTTKKTTVFETTVSKTEGNNYPQYFSVHKTDLPGKLQWYLSDPSTINQESFDEIINCIGTKGTNNRRLAIAYTFEYARFPLVDVKKSIENMLILAEKNDVAVILHLDGVNYWNYYPQLWNFWNPNSPGYNPENYQNVERYGWNKDTTVKIGWRNWGSQFRVTPAPNLASTAFLEMQKDCLAVLLPTIFKWYNNLPQDKKYLFGGVVLGWELSTYVQCYYYDGGNDLLDKPSSEDPTTGLNASLPLGYAAALELGLQNKGVITSETEDAICSFYMEYLISLAFKNGIPLDKIITHSFYGGATQNGGGQSGAASVSKYAANGVLAGWSFYEETINSIDRVIDLADGRNWAAIEFKPWGLSYDLLNQVINYRNCRIINIYNWESVRDNVDYLKIFKDILNFNL